MLKNYPMKKSARQISWEIRGHRWTYSLQASELADPVELVTRVLEEVGGIKEGSWESDGGDLFSGEEGISLGLLIVATHANMKNSDEHILIPVSMLLANAGFHQESTRLEKMVSLGSTAELLSHLVGEVGRHTKSTSPKG